MKKLRNSIGVPVKQKAPVFRLRLFALGSTSYFTKVKRGATELRILLSYIRTTSSIHRMAI